MFQREMILVAWQMPLLFVSLSKNRETTGAFAR